METAATCTGAQPVGADRAVLQGVECKWVIVELQRSQEKEHTQPSALSFHSVNPKDLNYHFVLYFL